MAQDERLRERLEELFYEAITEDRDAETNADPQTLGERCRKYAALAEQALSAAPATPDVNQVMAMVNDLCAAISRIRWAIGTDKLQAAIYEAVRLQSIADAGGYAKAAAPAPSPLTEEQVLTTSILAAEDIIGDKRFVASPEFYEYDVKEISGMIMKRFNALLAASPAEQPGAPACICAQGVTKCPKHGTQPAERGLCPKCSSVLGYCMEGEYCTKENCNYAY